MAFDGADTSDSPSPLSSSPWFPPLLIIPAFSWEDIFPHCDQNESGSFLSWLCPLSLQRYPTAFWHCRGRGWKGKGLAIPRDPHPHTPRGGRPLQSSTKQINSDKWVLVSAFYTLTWYQQLHWCSSPLLSPLCPLYLLGGLLSMWRSHWRKCQLNLRSLHTAVHLLSTVTRDLQQWA